MHTDAFSKCHPLVNFLFFLGAIGFGVVIQHPAYILAGFLGGLMYYLCLRGRGGVKSTLLLLPVFLFITCINPLFNHEGSHILFYAFGNPYTLEAICYGMAVAGIFLVMMVWFFCYNLVLTSDKFVCLFGRLIPALSMVLVMVLRLIPNLLRKAAQLAAARRSIGRGAGEGSTAKEKLRDGMQILSALTDWALEGGIITSDSMRARGYGSARRTNFHLYTFTVRDAAVLVLLAALAVLTLMLGSFDAGYTPELVIEPAGPGLFFYSLFLLVPTILHWKEVLQWHICLSKI